MTANSCNVKQDPEIQPDLLKLTFFFKCKYVLHAKVCFLLGEILISSEWISNLTTAKTFPVTHLFMRQKLCVGFMPSQNLATMEE